MAWSAPGASSVLGVAAEEEGEDDLFSLFFFLGGAGAGDDDDGDGDGDDGDGDGDGDGSFPLCVFFDDVGGKYFSSVGAKELYGVIPANGKKNSYIFSHNHNCLQIFLTFILGLGDSVQHYFFPYSLRPWSLRVWHRRGLLRT